MDGENMETRKGLLYSKTHEWIKVDGSKATIGLSDYAQENLGEIVFIELPKIGASLRISSVLSVAESVKAASEIYTPVSGQVTKVNTELTDHPEFLNQQPYESWIAEIEMADPSETAALMDEDTYRVFCLKEH
jgi:glycine cleavage system H protein